MSSTKQSLLCSDLESTDLDRSSPAQALGEQIQPFEDAHYDESRDSADAFFTPSMLKEEEELEKENLESEAKLLDDISELQITREQRLKQLNHLLDKSKFYTKYLLQKINAPSKSKKELPSKSADSSSEVSSQTSDSSNSQTTGKQTKKRKREQLDFSEYLDKEELTKKAKLDCQEENAAELPAVGSSEKQQPKLLVGGTLRDYQLDGFEWMKILYENGINGILADEMGLGKTIQCIALFAHLIEKGIAGPFLICAPLSTLMNWIAEVHKFTPAIPVILYHGSKEERMQLVRKLRKTQKVGSKRAFPIVVTSYEIVIRDSRELHNMNWKYIVLDEGHRIKNFKCILLRELKQYRSANRLLLTGTPLQNNLSELWSLLNFLIPEIFDNLEVFESWFDVKSLGESGSDEKIVAEEEQNQLLSTLHEILSPFLLRRMKADVNIHIPPKKELLLYASLTKLQEQYYRKVVDKSIRNLCPKQKRSFDAEVYDSKDTRISRKKTEAARKKLAVQKEAEACELFSETCINVKNIVMALRKCCNHPYLLSYPLDPTTHDYLVNEEIVNTSGKMLLLDAMLPKLKERGHKVLLFSQMTRMLDVLQDYCYLKEYKCCRLDGSMTMENRFKNISEFDKDPEAFIFLLSTRSGGLGLNLVAADTVIIYDSDWNPQCDLQAMDRCHRIGQEKPVVVYRLITSNTIDQKIVERAASKRKLEKMIIYKGKFKNAASSTKGVLDTEELLEMLKSADHQRVITARNANHESKIGLTDEVLEEILDRSDMIEDRVINGAMKKTSNVKQNSFFKRIS